MLEPVAGSSRVEGGLDEQKEPPHLPLRRISTMNEAPWPPRDFFQFPRHDRRLFFIEETGIEDRSSHHTARPDAPERASALLLTWRVIALNPSCRWRQGDLILPGILFVERLIIDDPRANRSQCSRPDDGSMFAGSLILANSTSSLASPFREGPDLRRSRPIKYPASPSCRDPPGRNNFKPSGDSALRDVSAK